MEPPPTMASPGTGSAQPYVHVQQQQPQRMMPAAMGPQATMPAGVVGLAQLAGNMPRVVAPSSAPRTPQQPSPVMQSPIMRQEMGLVNMRVLPGQVHQTAHMMPGQVPVDVQHYGFDPSAGEKRSAETMDARGGGGLKTDVERKKHRPKTPGPVDYTPQKVYARLLEPGEDESSLPPRKSISDADDARDRIRGRTGRPRKSDHKIIKLIKREGPMGEQWYMKQKGSGRPKKGEEIVQFQVPFDMIVRQDPWRYRYTNGYLETIPNTAPERNAVTLGHMTHQEFSAYQHATWGGRGGETGLPFEMPQAAAHRPMMMPASMGMQHMVASNGHAAMMGHPGSGAEMGGGGGGGGGGLINPYDAQQFLYDQRQQQAYRTHAQQLYAAQMAQMSQYQHLYRQHMMGQMGQAVAVSHAGGGGGQMHQMGHHLSQQQQQPHVAYSRPPFSGIAYSFAPTLTQ
eukprot:m.41902 g.41902  ORF g.41902 m.41902 type:complete len:455 (+) comp6194_c0_seq1:231-1595(+)